MINFGRFPKEKLGSGFTLQFFCHPEYCHSERSRRTKKAAVSIPNTKTTVNN